jgi:D-amino-acid dehydrogenase
MKVTIIGGGVIGLCSAYYLQKQGHQVTIVERNDITDGCSFGNMGYISPSHFVPLATPGMISQGIKWMMSSSSPFYIQPRLNLDLLRWGMAFWRSANAKQVEKSIPHLNNLLQLSRALMTDLKAAMPGSFEMLEKGCWMLYKNEKTGDHEKHLAEQAAALGLKTLICSRQEVQAKETAVEVDVAGGILYLDDCHVNPAQLMQALYQHLKSVGVKFWLNTTVTGFEKEGKKVTKILTDKADLDCEELVIANGSWIEPLSKLLGLRVLMQGGKGYSMVYDDLPANLQHPSILVDDRVATTPIGPWLRIGGTMEISGHNDTILPKRVMAIYEAFKKYYPTLHLPAPDPAKAWFGYRPVSPDGMPHIGRHKKIDNLVYAGGHAMLGVSAAAGTGQLVSEIIERRPTAISVEGFKPDRFG